MELFGVGIENVAAGGVLRGGCGALGGTLGQMALARHIINGNAGLHVVDVYVEADAIALILYRVSLHLYASRYQLISNKDGRHAEEHMVLGFLYVVGDHILKGEHPVHVHIAGSRDQILVIGVFSRELKADEMAAIVEVFSIHDVILYRLPARWLDRADAFPILGGHQIHADAGNGNTAAPQGIQLTVALIGGGDQLIRGERGDIIVQGNVGDAAVGRQIGKLYAMGGRLCGALRGSFILWRLRGDTTKQREKER